MNSIIVFRAICSFFIIIQFYCKNKCFLFYLQKSFGYLWDLWVIYEHLCSNLQFISLPEEVGEFLLYIMLKLYQAKIIDFWASWCAPCRALTPQLVKLYNEFHEQGLEIIGISLDDKKEAWIKAIEEENIPWFQGSKLDGFKPDNPLNQLYGIHGIPHIVLLNTDNQIVVTTTDIKILREEILKLFKQ